MSENRARGADPAYPAFVKGRQGFADIPTVEDKHFPGMTKRERFAMACLTWQPSEDEISHQESMDKARNPYNEPHKPKLRDRHEIIAQLQLRRADALIAELNKEPKS